jgi:glycosyltransferase involved in cell wall biosynthesis
MLVEGLILKGHQVIVITTKHPEGIKEESLDTARIYYLYNTRLGRYSRSWWKESIRKFEDLNEKEEFDIIYSESAGGFSYLERRIKGEYNIPILIGIHGTALGEVKTKLRQRFSLRVVAGVIKNIYGYFRDRRLLPYADALIACSEEVRKAILEELPILEKNVFTILHGIDTVRFSPQIDSCDLQRGLDIKRDEKVLLFAGRLKEEKGIGLLVKVFKEVLTEYKEVRLIIVGSGEFEARARKMVDQLEMKEKVVFAGSVNHMDIPIYHSLSDIFVLPTLRQEGLPYVILEAMACGKPIVASKIGGIPSVIEDGKEGFLIKPGDIKALKERIIYLLKNPQDRESMGERGRGKVVKEFSKERMVEETIKVFERIKR